VGLVESYGYGWYATLIWVPIYNVVVRVNSEQLKP
jgi:hypothetical protein